MRPVLLAVLLAFAFPVVASATSPLVIADAEAFWAPYNGGVPPCGTALHLVHFGGAGAGFQPSRAMAFAVPGIGGCLIHVNLDYWPWVADRARCTVIAHELGHSYFGLGHSDDPANVMTPHFSDYHAVPTCSRLSLWTRQPGESASTPVLTR